MKKNIRRITLMFVFGFCLFTGMFFRATPAYGDEEEGELVITVVEEIPAEDIYDEEVPMAALPYSANQNGTRHLLMMSALLVLAFGYVGYFSHYEKKIDHLKQMVIEEEEKLMQERERKGEKR